VVNYHYVIIETVAENGKAASIERGLFKGLNSVGDGTFLWIKTSDSGKVSKSCNLSYYNILSIETYDGTTRCFTFFRKGKKEQKKGLVAITEIYDILKEKILLKDDDYMLDTDKYRDIPKNLEVGSKGIIGRGIRPAAAATNLYGNSSYTAPVYQRKDPEPTAFKRRSKKPTEDSLATLNGKLDLITKGEYIAEFPKVKGEKKTANKGGEVVNPDDVEEYYGTPFAC